MKKKRLSHGMIQVYTGNGKGKTTAALGLAVRAAGYGYKTFMIQFMKGNIEYGELETAKKLTPYLTIRQMGRGHLVSRKKIDSEDIKLAQEAMALARSVISGRKYDIVVLDEINVAVEFGLIHKEEVLKLMDERPSNVELILTGRYAAQEMIERADLVTEMAEIKHYYQRGVQSRVGIER
ncbi:MAG: cob(I)yrinic acid a,c-diamide adenosyltransferase [Deltaproteobacteria bacterium RBG_13_52_11]|nr:MAG: cob(I)yrinic acid a,c-diamide adenosyltransferase [Deltaproteobacteria bacterium RBG_13_52_11]